MLKKVLLGALVVGFAGVLVAGAIERTETRTARVVEAQAQPPGGQGNGGGQGQGRGSAQSGDAAQPRGGQGNGGAQGQGRGSTQSGDAAQLGVASAQGYGEQDRAYSDGGAGTLEWQTETGTAASVDASTLTVTTASGAPVIIDGRAWSFAQAEGFAVQPGDAVTVTGFYEDGEFKAAAMENAATGQTIQLRDTTGRPAWSGQGNSAGGSETFSGSYSQGQGNGFRGGQGRSGTGQGSSNGQGGNGYRGGQ